MSFYTRNRGKFVKYDPDCPRAIGQCDITSSLFAHSDLIKQMEWRGDSLVWTGLMVGRPFVDKPNPQNRPPPVKNDPTVVQNPRLIPTYQPLSDNTLTYDEIFAQLQTLQQGLPDNTRL